MANEKLKFLKLTPKGNVDLDVYYDAIDFAMKNADLRNIAISGAYGAGKSSVLETYKNRHHEKKFIHISLSHFSCESEAAFIGEVSTGEDGNSSETKETPAKEIQLATLEGKILNQLIHQIPEDRIPQTRFKVKRNLSKQSIIISAALWILAGLCVVYFLTLGFLSKFIEFVDNGWIKQLLGWVTDPDFTLLCGFVLLILGGIGIYFFVRAQKNKSIIRKLNLQGNEIEIFEDSEESYFDKYLNEVLYLFRNSNADVIVFEDLDRYNMGLIFERLREVNTLVNAQNGPGQKPLKFFYLLRDDVFTSKDRVKFFDYIIPVVPVMDGSNSYELIVKMFEDAGIINSFDRNFLQGLSLYIDDMRLLQNIYNEFLVYYYRLNITELDCNKMLAIITYKNIYPKDFCDLQLGHGFVHSLFANKDLFIKEEIETLEREINKYQRKTEEAEAEIFEKKEEIDFYYEMKYARDRLGNKRTMDTEKKKELDERKKHIADRLSHRLPEFNLKIDQCRKRIAELNSATLKEIITRDNINSIFSVTDTNAVGIISDFYEVRGNEYFDLLKYLIREGFIDESYSDYMTYFYEGSLSLGDKLFLRSITDKRAKPAAYRIKNPALVVSRLRSADFDQVEILNYDLLDYLLANKNLEPYLGRVCTQLMRTENYAFVSGYYAQASIQRPNFICCMNKQWPEMFAGALRQKSFPSEQLHSYIVESMYYLDDDVICEVNKENCLHDYIVSTENFLEIEAPQIDKIIHGFSVLNVLFPRFVSEHANNELLEAVYENAQYEINYENLCFIYGRFIGAATEYDLQHRNYSLLIQAPQSCLTKHIEQNFEKYMDVILEACQQKILDEEQAALKLLNNPNVTEEQMKTYISYYQLKFSALALIEDKTLWSVLLSNEKVIPSPENINTYFSEKKMFDSELIKYINSFPSNFDFSELATVLGDDSEPFFDEAIECNELNNGVYTAILCALGYTYSSFTIEGIEESKTVILIENRIIKMTKESLPFMRRVYPNLLKRYICSNLTEYVGLVKDGLFNYDELLDILTWNVPDDVKIELLAITDYSISIAGKAYSESVCVHILNNNYDTNDFEYLVLCFDELPNAVKNAFIPHAEENVEDIINSSDNVSKLLLVELLHSAELHADSKIALFSAFIPKLTYNEILSILDLLDLPEYKAVFDMKKRPAFPIDDTSEILLAAFKTAKWITDYSTDSKRPDFYKITRKDAKRVQNSLFRKN